MNPKTWLIISAVAAALAVTLSKVTKFLDEVENGMQESWLRTHPA